MAKSLRSHSKLAARNRKRYDPKSDYAVVQAARLHATSSRLAEKNKHGKTLTEEEAEAANDVDALEGDEKMQDGAEEQKGAAGSADVGKETQTKGWYPLSNEPKKVSTSGTRESRRETWRRAKGWKPKVGSKNGGKPKRRR